MGDSTMIIHDLKQGSNEWHEFRLNHFGASEAAPMLGLSSKVTRNELLHMKHTGQAKEYSDWVENVLFANGHDVEEKARLILEDEIKDDLYPVTCSDGSYSASCDGLTLDQSVAFEHKQYNQQLADSVRNGVLPDEYMPQCQQILMVTGADTLIFVVSDGTADNREKMNISPDAKWFNKLKHGWKQFQIDLEDYVPKDIQKKPEPDAIMQLPALSIQIKGEVTTSNLPAFKHAAETFISNINTDLKTDNDFANAEATVKFCAETESKIEAAKSAAIAQTASIDELMRTMDHIKESIRQKRLTLEKLVKSQKEAIKNKIIDDAYKLALDHIGELESEIKIVKFTSIAGLIFTKRDFIESTKNKRTLESLHNAVDTKLAEVKIMLDAAAKNVRDKMSWLTETGKESLFPDIQQLINQDNEHFKLTLKTRIEDHEKRVAEEAQRKIEAEQAANEHAAKQAEIEAAAKQNVTEKADPVEVKVTEKQPEQKPKKQLSKIDEIEIALAEIVDSCRSTDNIPRIIALAIADGRIPHVSVAGSVEKAA